MKLRIKNDSITLSYNQISLFGATLSLTTAAIFFLFRFGLSEKYLPQLLSCTGFSLIILLSPVFIRQNLRSEGYRNFFLSDTIIPIYLVLIAALTGRFFTVDGELSGIVFFVVGMSFYVLAVFNYVVNSKLLQVAASAILALMFGVYLGSVYWTLLADPLFLENIVFGKSHLDPLFHASIAQMVKTYGVASTGLNLLPPIQYHIGSHILIGCLSKFLDVGVLEFYNFGYVIIFLPLLLRTMLSFIVVFKAAFLKLTVIKLDYLFWGCLFAPFVGFMSFDGNSLAQNAGIGYQIIIYSESYSISFIYTFALFSSIVLLSNIYANYPVKLFPLLVCLLLVIPLLTFLGGITKISTLLLLTSCCCYLFLRLRLYRNWHFVVSIAVVLVGFGLVYMATSDPRDREGGFYLFQFTHEIIKAPWYQFISIYYSLTIVFICMVFYTDNLFSLGNIRSAVQTKKTIVLEILLVIAIVGFIPGEVLKFYQGNSTYFSEFQYWIAASFILCYLSIFVEKAKLFFTGYRRAFLIPVLLMGLYVGYKMNKNWGVYYRRAVDRNMNDRRAMIDYPDPLENNALRLQFIRDLRTLNAKGIDSLVTTFGRNVERELQRSDRYKFLKKLKALDDLPVKEKQEALLCVANLQSSSLMECYKIPFLFPAFTGIAIYEGVPDDSCIGLESYGYEWYKENRRGVNRGACPTRSGSDKVLLKEFKSSIFIDASALTIEERKTF